MLLQNKVILICGIANERSLATAIMKSCVQEGAQLVVTYQNDRTCSRVKKIVAKYCPDAVCCQLDVCKPETISQTVQLTAERYGQIDGLVHAVAWGAAVDECGAAQSVLATSAEHYAETLNISARSLAVLTAACAPYFTEQASVLTLSFVGARTARPGYNIMGIAKAALESSVRYLASELGPHGQRVNALSAGSVRTLASSAVPGFKERYQAAAERAPLRRNTTAEDVAGTAIFLLSSLSSGITGQTLSVDCGESIV